MSSEWECLDIIFGQPEARRLRPGVLDYEAEFVFTHGHCHSFAEAVRRLVPTAEMVLVCDEPPHDGGVHHVVVRLGQRYLGACGWVVDGRGSGGGNRAFESEWDRVEVIEPGGWLATGGSWFELRVDDAVPFAATLLWRLGVPIGGRAQLST